MSLPASVEGHAFPRLFCALRLPAATLDVLEAWQSEHLSGRVVLREHVHVTLAFLGRTPAAGLEAVGGELRRSAAATGGGIVLRARRYRETGSVGMIELEDVGARSARLAATLHEGLERLGVYRREQRPWLPHLTVLRFRRRPGLHPPLPELGAFSPSEAAVYHSVLRPTGAQYEVLESYALGG